MSIDHHFDFRKYEPLAVCKRRSQLESDATEESASHLTSAFEVEMQSATSFLKIRQIHIAAKQFLRESSSYRLVKRVKMIRIGHSGKDIADLRLQGVRICS